MAHQHEPGPLSHGHSNGHAKGLWSRMFGRRPIRDGALEPYRRLALTLRLDLGETDTARRLMLTCPTSTKLCVHAALDLARFLAEEQDHSVLVIDACSDGSGVSRWFGKERDPGWLDRMPLDADEDLPPLVDTGHHNVFLLPVGRPASGRAARLLPQDLQRLLERASQQFDYVILQCRSLLDDPAALAYPSLVDCVLLLAIENETRLDQLDECRKSLESCRAKKVGLVITPRPRHRLRKPNHHR